MPTLVIETATAACSVAMIDGSSVLGSRHEVVGRGHAERLVPMIAELLDGAVPEAILVDCGPGSFTGVRVGIAAARGLAIGWGIPAQGYSSLTLMARAHFFAHPHCAELAVLSEGGHGELFMQAFTASPFAASTALGSVSPEVALEQAGARTIIGSGAARLLEIDPALDAHDALPEARAAAWLPAEHRTLPPRPIYGRAPDAKVASGGPTR
ncbi:tRNA (adenosine(37)-N6)-threonylcarbamoyltransferase complex dimerization subunit type 1 TsaB [Sphingomonas japonica]|uniref:tRNA threonylcarbamoyl adenosine modification protein YeaZ n=1 Tax=Sphingomonas japonica TaxID=511662 RepID=A0ABX0U054_9SPHN|nr:tRNA (adenosine(37)-N6)-threonylcarbamoyltransferase complex dimerization subunit type 1 TsaB [Sphingomonas japonica]NIJ22661.1 tRNA threonylcarbamoyl adenosine modification protein YeaZ [Sphingomonas japonica]